VVSFTPFLERGKSGEKEGAVVEQVGAFYKTFLLYIINILYIKLYKYPLLPLLIFLK